MNPQAWLKSANWNFFWIASRPVTSAQPVSEPSASLRALPVSLAVMSLLLLWRQACLIAGAEPRLASVQEASVKLTRRSALVAASSLAIAPSARAEKATDTLRIQFVDAVPNLDMYFNSQRTGLILA